MKHPEFVQRLQMGKVNNLIYSLDENEGLVSVWKHDGSFILTWEECPTGQQYDESTYRRDERHVFANVNALLEFLTNNGLDTDLFAK